MEMNMEFIKSGEDGELLSRLLISADYGLLEAIELLVYVSPILKEERAPPKWNSPKKTLMSTEEEYEERKHWKMSEASDLLAQAYNGAVFGWIASRNDEDSDVRKCAHKELTRYWELLLDSLKSDIIAKENERKKNRK